MGPEPHLSCGSRTAPRTPAAKHLTLDTKPVFRSGLCCSLESDSLARFCALFSLSLSPSLPSPHPLPREMTSSQVYHRYFN